MGPYVATLEGVPLSTWSWVYFPKSSFLYKNSFKTSTTYDYISKCKFSAQVLTYQEQIPTKSTGTTSSSTKEPGWLTGVFLCRSTWLKMSSCLGGAIPTNKQNRGLFYPLFTVQVTCQHPIFSPNEHRLSHRSRSVRAIKDTTLSSGPKSDHFFMTLK